MRVPVNPLPEYSRQKLELLRELANANRKGSIDLLVGKPIDPMPDVIQKALVQGSDALANQLIGSSTQLARQFAIGLRSVASRRGWFLIGYC